MKTKEARRLGLVEEAVAGNLTVQEVADRLGLSRRQVFRIRPTLPGRGSAGASLKGVAGQGQGHLSGGQGNGHGRRPIEIDS